RDSPKPTAPRVSETLDRNTLGFNNWKALAAGRRLRGRDTSSAQSPSLRCGDCSAQHDNAWSLRLPQVRGLPGVVGIAVARGVGGGGVDIDDARILLVYGEQDLVLNHLPVWFVGHGIVGNLVYVAGCSEIVEGLRRSLLVERVSPNGIPQLRKVRSQ